LKYKDFTIKARISDPLTMETLLIKMNARYIGMDHQRDTYFEVEKGKLKWRRGDIENLITHYERIFENGLEKTIVYRFDLNPTEIEVENLFSRYSTLAIIEKERKIFFIENNKIHLDKTADGRMFIEIEAFDKNGSQTMEELKQQCIRLQTDLKINKVDLVKTGYL
jgi:adenylate cyclase class 2